MDGYTQRFSNILSAKMHLFRRETTRCDVRRLLREDLRCIQSVGYRGTATAFQLLSDSLYFFFMTLEMSLYTHIKCIVGRLVFFVR